MTQTFVVNPRRTHDALVQTKLFSSPTLCVNRRPASVQRCGQMWPSANYCFPKQRQDASTHSRLRKSSRVWMLLGLGLWGHTHTPCTALIIVIIIWTYMFTSWLLSYQSMCRLPVSWRWRRYLLSLSDPHAYGTSADLGAHAAGRRSGMSGNKGTMVSIDFRRRKRRKISLNKQNS